MYFLSTIHPHLKETEDPKYNGDWLTIEQKRKVIDKFYKTKRELPLCIDHCNANRAGFVVPYDKRTGKVLDLFMDGQGDLIAKSILYEDDEHYPEIAQGIIIRKEKWGVSVWMDLDLESSPVGKDLTHVALTLNPYLKDYNSYIHQYSYNEEAIDNTIIQYYYDKSLKSNCYLSNQFKQKLKPKMIEYENYLEKENKKIKSDLEKMATPIQETTNESSNTAATTTTSQEVANNGATTNSSSSSSFSSKEPFRFSTSYDEAIRTKDLGKIRHELNIMENYMEKNKIPLQKQDRDFKTRYMKLEETKEEALKSLIDNLKYLHEEHGLPGDVAAEYRDLYNSNDTTSSRPITAFVAASFSAYTSQQNENLKLREQFKVMESEKSRIQEETTKLQRENEELKRMRTSGSSYSTTSNKSYSDYDTRHKERFNEESSGKLNLLSAFNKERTKPIDNWVSNYMVPQTNSIFESFSKPPSFETDEQGISNLRKMAAYMSKPQFERCNITVSHSVEDFK